jgi:hypothetical protein
MRGHRHGHRGAAEDEDDPVAAQGSGDLKGPEQVADAEHMLAVDQDGHWHFAGFRIQSPTSSNFEKPRRKYRIEIEIGIAVEIEKPARMTASKSFIFIVKPSGLQIPDRQLMNNITTDQVDRIQKLPCAKRPLGITAIRIRSRSR